MSQLSRIERPGQEYTDYGYDSYGRIISSRDSLANDAIAANVIIDDSNATSAITYDTLGRVSSIQLPRGSVGQTRLTKTIDYVLNTTKLVSSLLMKLSKFVEFNFIIFLKIIIVDDYVIVIEIFKIFFVSYHSS